MRKVVVSTYVTLDGVMEAPEKWSIKFFNEEAMEFAQNQLFASDALLLGRVTYEGFAAAWPSRSGDEFSDRMNALPKHVVSTTLEEPLEWNNSTLIKGDVVEEVSRLKQQEGEDILVYGSADLTRTLMESDLIDEYRIWVEPVVVGSGKRLFEEQGGEKELELVDTTTFRTGAVILSYRPIGDGAGG